MLKLPCVQAERSCSATIGLRQSAYTHGVGFFFIFYLTLYTWTTIGTMNICSLASVYILHLTMGYCNEPVLRVLRWSNHSVRLTSHFV